MKVLLVNGSPHEHGCTDAALQIVANTLAEQGIESQIFWAGAQPVGGCVGCGACRKVGHCVFDGPVNDLLAAAADADGFVFGSPVHYAGISGNMKSLMDRAFYAGSALFRYKPAGILVSARRAGTTAALDQLAKYPTFGQMPLVSSCYWTMVHGQNAEQVAQDAEGCAILQQLGRNMAWLMQCLQAGARNGVALPEYPARPMTNFVR